VLEPDLLAGRRAGRNHFPRRIILFDADFELSFLGFSLFLGVKVGEVFY